MKSFLLMTGSGPLVILTKYKSMQDPSLMEKLHMKGVEKYIGYEVPLDMARERYGGHFNAVINDWHESDGLRVLDFNGHRALKLFSFAELGEPHFHEP